jgi:hypothetical protein
MHRGRAFCCLLVVAFTALLLAAAPALADDVTPPQIVAFSLTPSHIDTESAAQSVTLTVTFTDDQSGVASANWGLDLPGSAQWGRGGPLDLVSGTALSCTYTGAIVLPKGTQSGDWLASVGVSDSAGNGRVLLPEELAGLFGAAAVRVTNDAATYDGSPPQVTSFDLSPSHIDTSDADQAVTLTVTIDEEGTGLDLVGAHLGPLSVNQPQHSFFLQRVSGDDSHAVYSGVATIPKGSRGGAWAVQLWAYDRATNATSLYPSDLADLFGAENVQVVNDAPLTDEAPPTVLEFSITPDEFDTSAGPQTLTLRVTVADDSAGIEHVYGQIMPLIGIQSITMDPLKVSGDDHLAVYECTVTVPWLAKEGIWRPRLYVEDKLGNGRWLEAAALDELVPEAPGLILVNTATADQVTIDREWTLQNGLNTVTFPAGTVVTRSDGGSFAFYRMTAQPFTIDDVVPTTDLDGQPLATLRLGIPGLNLTFSKPVSVSMYLGAQYAGYRLSVQSLLEDADSWSDEVTVTAHGGFATFPVTHATRFAATALPRIRRRLPGVAHRGALVTIRGRDFGSVRGRVKLGSTTITRCRSWRAGQIEFRVPARARLGRLKLRVVTAAGTSNSVMLRLTPRRSP